VPSKPDDFIDPRLLEKVDLGDGREVTVRRGAIGLVLADEAQGLVKAYAEVPGDASYLGREVEVACSSVKRGTDAVFVAEWFTGWLFTRHIAESAIRAAWVAKGDDGPAVTERLRRLEKRDWKLLLSADKAITEEVGRGMLVNREEVLTFEPGMAAQHAPLDLRALASQAGEPGIYEIWRWASVLVHPGFSNYLHSVNLYKGEAVLRALHMSFATLTYAARDAFRKLAPDVEVPDVSANVATLRGGGKIDFGPAPEEEPDI
jgi:hypothetical protein